MRIRFTHGNFLHVVIFHEGKGIWELTLVYACPSACIRKHLWEKLNEIVVVHPWLIVGDFNCVLSGVERISGRGASSCLINWVKQKGLLDLGYSWPSFTWKHGNNVKTTVAVCLDRGLCDIDWRSMFPTACIKHSPYSHSDHCPLLIRLEVGDQILRLFILHALWMLHRDFHGLVAREWQGDFHLPKL